jgi:undecaprenyl diphosphate synthase
MAENNPKHIAIIMDGNRRWAKARGLGSAHGHRAGTDALEKIVEAASKIAIETVTVYALSTENLQERTKTEISAIFGIVREGFKTRIRRMMENGVKVEVIGELDGLPGFIRNIIIKTNRFEVRNKKIKLNIAFNYGGKREIVLAVKKMVSDSVEINEMTLRERLFTFGQSDPELIIRTGGKMRLSNFLLWQTAYSELYFSKKLWPDFSERDLKSAVAWYKKQQRNFGK